MIKLHILGKCKKFVIVSNDFIFACLKGSFLQIYFGPGSETFISVRRSEQKLRIRIRNTDPKFYKCWKICFLPFSLQCQFTKIYLSRQRHTCDTF
jgi:hypothetical protein